MEIEFNNLKQEKGAIGIIFCDHNSKLIGYGKKLDQLSKKYLSNTINADESFKARKSKNFDYLVVHNLQNFTLSKLYIFKLKNMKNASNRDFQILGGNLLSLIKFYKENNIIIYPDGVSTSKLSFVNSTSELLLGFLLASYKFTKYFSKLDKKRASKKTKIKICTSQFSRLEKNYETVKAIHEGVTMTRNLVTEPPNVMTPPELAKNAATLEKIGVKVTILGEKEMTKLGMGSLLSVGRGSEHESKLAIMEWKGHKNKKKKPIAFIGKGVSFDTGGVSLKPAGGMEEMKYDMGGSGVVIGLMKTLALRKAKANVIGVVGLVENHIGNMATRPSDVVKSYSGQTIEVLNTDAEGRLVLADALWYTQEKYKPELMVDLATLTGAIIIAIGNEYAGLFSNNDKLSKQLEDAGKIEDEKLWRFPLHDKFDKMINSPIADMQNISNGRGAGSITAAQFLQRFVNKVPWAHLDIAGTTWSKTNLPTSPKGATAFGVKLLNKFVSKYHEGK
ncbi:leucyl aminopeptidase [Pelagibacteraceae bacterium]|nr:leucyl aminopeptidase [Pelagibacteraceae bacterium]